MVGRHRIILIAAVDDNWAIGKNNQLLYKIPLDMEHFRGLTEGNIIVYGFNTLLSFPQRKILPDRDNIILTSKSIACGDDKMYVAHSIDDVVRIISEIDDCRHVFICGGSSVYKQFLKIADWAYITKIHATTDDADAYFPNLDMEYHWRQSHQYGPFKDEESGLMIEFTGYLNKEG